MHSGLSALLCRIARGGGPSTLLGVDRGVAVSILQRSSPRQAADGTDPDVFAGVGDGRRTGRTAAKADAARARAQKILKSSPGKCALGTFRAALCTEGLRHLTSNTNEFSPNACKEPRIEPPLHGLSGAFACQTQLIKNPRYSRIQF